MTEQSAPEALADLAAAVDRLARRRPVVRAAYTRQEAAESIGVSVDHLERHVLPDLRLIRSGRLVLVPAAELDRWADRAAAQTLDKRKAT
jgi:excisionase family DNA binding protein